MVAGMVAPWVLLGVGLLIVLTGATYNWDEWL